MVWFATQTPVTDALIRGAITAETVGRKLYAKSPAETTAGAVIVDYTKPAGYAARYGDNAVPGTTDLAAAIQMAVDVLEIEQGGRVVLPAEVCRITTPIINDVGGVTFFGEGAGERLNVHQTTVYLDSATAGDYAIKLADPSYNAGDQLVTGINFAGTNRANNQGGVLIAGRHSHLWIHKCNFQDFTGYAIGRDPAAGQSYTQNNSLRDIGFSNVGGCYGLISEPAAGADYLAETLLTIDNVNLDNSINPTDPKPYIWDFRASRVIECGIMLNEGAGAVGVTAIMAFCSGSLSHFATLWNEFPSNVPTYSVIVVADATNKFSGNQDSVITIDRFASSSVPVRFDAEATAMESTIIVGDWVHYTAVATTDFVSFGGDQGRLEVKRAQVKTPIIVPENLYGRLILGQVAGDKEVRATITQRSMELARWDATMGSLADADLGYFTVAVDNAIASSALETDGNFKVMRYTGLAISVPNVSFWFNFPTSWQGAYFTIAIRYRATIDAADVNTVFRALYSDANHFDDISVINDGVENDAEYQTAYLTARIGAQAPQNKVWVRHTGTAPTVAPIVRIQSIQAWLGQPEDFAIASPAADTTKSFTRSDGSTGGAASAGAGNQYVEIVVNGTKYKVLHDGTL